VKKERIRQVRTKSPIKILFLGVGSKVISLNKISNVKVQNPNQSFKKDNSKCQALNPCQTIKTHLKFNIPLTFEL
jgi:hypothetical protein